MPDAEVIDIVAFLDTLDVKITKVALEAGTLTQYLTYGLQFAGYEVICMESYRVRTLLTSRRALLDKCIDLENEIRGIFKIFGVKLPSKLGHGSFDRIVRPVIEADEVLSMPLLPVLDARLGLCYRADVQVRGR